MDLLLLQRQVRLIFVNLCHPQIESTLRLLSCMFLLSIVPLWLPVQQAAHANDLAEEHLKLNEFAVKPSPRFDSIQSLMKTSTVCLHWYSAKRIGYVSNSHSATSDLFTYEKVLSKTKLEKSKKLLVVILHPRAKDVTELPRPLTEDKSQIESLELMNKQRLPLFTSLGFRRTLILGYGIDGFNHPSYLVLSDEHR